MLAKTIDSFEQFPHMVFKPFRTPSTCESSEEESSRFSIRVPFSLFAPTVLCVPYLV